MCVVVWENSKKKGGKNKWREKIHALLTMKEIGIHFEPTLTDINVTENIKQQKPSVFITCNQKSKEKCKN